MLFELGQSRKCTRSFTAAFKSPRLAARVLLCCTCQSTTQKKSLSDIDSSTEFVDLALVCSLSPNAGTTSRVAILLYPGVEPRPECGRDPVSATGPTLAAGAQPGRSAQLIQVARTLFQRAVLMTLYATGGRRAEVATLKVRDIDSQRMVVHIHGGKGRKDRDVMLNPRLLDALRAFWRSKRPRVSLFPSSNGHRGIEYPASSATLIVLLMM
jgi:hypothetical protein